MTSPFSIDQLAAFLLGAADEDDRAAINAALADDLELAAQLGILQMMLPSPADVPQPQPERTPEALEPTVGLDTEETALPAGATPKYLRPLPEDLEEIALLDEQGLDPAEIASRVKRTRTTRLAEAADAGEVQDRHTVNDGRV